MTPGLPLHPLHGVHTPTDTTPTRRPGSVRRTSTMDAVRPEPSQPRLLLAGRARDLLTEADGSASVLGEASLELEVDDTASGPRVRSLVTSPAVDGLEGLVGLPAGAGFRRAVGERTSVEPGTGEHLLLDEVPVCTLVSYYAVLHERVRRKGLNPVPVGNDPRDPATHPADACAGFATGGVIMEAIDRSERAIATGPPAPSVLTDDEEAWHELPTELPFADRIRRWRRTDAWTDEDGNWQVDNFYRDSHTDPEGIETVVHEYSVQARVEIASTRVLECIAEPHALPFVECFPAARSADRVTGLKLADLREAVRRSLVGPATCTHLNDQLRGLADVESLARHLASDQQPPHHDSSLSTT
jgi:Protein of unknown function (DUF2889)